MSSAPPAAEGEQHVTQKSHKSLRRDKPKHSSQIHNVAKKGGAGGKGTWGAEKDDIKYMDEDGHAMDHDDPNFDPADQNEVGYNLSELVQGKSKHKPSITAMGDLTTYKALVRDALNEFLVSHLPEEFLAVVSKPEFTLFHQDLPAILIKYALDKPEADRHKISELLHELYKTNVVTMHQMAQGFRKLYSIIEELRVDAPNSKMILAEFVGHAHAAGYLDGKELAEMEDELAFLADPSKVQSAKTKISSICHEYLASGMLEELLLGVQAVPRAMQVCCLLYTICCLLSAGIQYDVIKQLVSIAVDHSDQQRELANRAIAEIASSTIAEWQAVKGFTVLLERVEDLTLDVPDVPRLLSLILARAIADEAVPPSFLLRLDLASEDQGFKVATMAHDFLVNQPRAAEMLADVWGGEEQEEEE